MSKKILRIIYDWPDENVITEGLAPAPYELSISQAKLGHKIYVLCGNLNGKNLKRLNFKYALENNKITVFNLPRAIQGLGPFFTTSPFTLFYFLALKVTGKIDIVHNHNHLGLCFLIYKYLFGWLDKTPVVGHFHIVAKAREKVAKAQKDKIPFFTKYVEFNLHKLSDFLLTKVSSQMVAVSQDVLEDVKQIYHVPDTKISLLETGVNTDRFKKEGEIADLGFLPEDKVLINIGRLGKRKNIDILVDSLKFLPQEYKLVLVGKWDSSKFKNKVDEIIFENHLKGRVRFLGSVSYFDIDRYFRSAAGFVLPSSYEGLPKVVVEALASGCKVLASGFSMQEKIPDIHL